jgi:hypothetical protein
VQAILNGVSELEIAKVQLRVIAAFYASLLDVVVNLSREKGGRASRIRLV